MVSTGILATNSDDGPTGLPERCTTTGFLGKDDCTLTARMESNGCGQLSEGRRKARCAGGVYVRTSDRSDERREAAHQFMH